MPEFVYRRSVDALIVERASHGGAARAAARWCAVSARSRSDALRLLNTDRVGALRVGAAGARPRAFIGRATAG
jgi:hypothetical protein